LAIETKGTGTKFANLAVLVVVALKATKTISFLNWMIICITKIKEI